MRKIDLADEILVLNVGGYVGESTRREIAHAERRRKPLRYLEGVVEYYRGQAIQFYQERQSYEVAASGVYGKWDSLRVAREEIDLGIENGWIKESDTRS